jgi:hypothetical protein
MEGTGFAFCSNSPCNDSNSLHAPPPDLPFGSHSAANGVPSGHEVKYQCNLGFTISGNSSIVCTGGIFPPPESPPVCSRDLWPTLVMISVLGVALVANAWIVKNYLIHDRVSACPSSLSGLVAELGLTVLARNPAPSAWRPALTYQDRGKMLCSGSDAQLAQLTVGDPPRRHRLFCQAVQGGARQAVSRPVSCRSRDGPYV